MDSFLARNMKTRSIFGSDPDDMIRSLGFTADWRRNELYSSGVPNAVPKI